MNYGIFPRFELAISLLCAFCILAGCSIAHQPRPADDFEVAWEIQEPTRTSPKAELFLTDHGYWGYSPEDRGEFEPEFVAGDIVTIDSQPYAHLFVVVEPASWGYRLQRLDDQPIEPTSTVDLRSLSNEELDEHPGLCRLDNLQDIRESCGVSHRHRRWRLYELNGENNEMTPTISGRFDQLGGVEYPVRPVALAGADHMSNWLEPAGETSSPGALLAVEMAPRTEVRLRPQVVYDESCKDIPHSTGLVEVVIADFEAAGVTLQPDAHPVTVEDAAMRLGADAMVTCSTDGPYLSVPMLTRLLLTDEDGRHLAPSSVGLISRNLADLSPGAQRAWTRAAALSAVGDPAAASFWTEQALAESTTDAAERLALASMPVLATGGRPELALRVGTEMTAGAWNPENDPDYLDGLIALFAVFDESKTLRDRLEHRKGLVERHHSHRSGWHRWFELRRQLDDRRANHGPAYHDLIAELQDDDLDGWALAVWAELENRGLELPVVDDPDDLDARFEEFDALQFWSSIRARASFDDCLSERGSASCMPGSYGWTPTDGHTDDIDSLDELRSTAPLTWRGGYAGQILASGADAFDTPSDQTAYWLAVSPLVSDTDLASITAATTRAIHRQFQELPDSLCHQRPLWKTHFQNAAARSDSINDSDERRQWSRFLDWWTDYGVDGLCGEPDEFLDALVDHASSSDPWLAEVLPLFETIFLGHSTAYSDLTVFYRAAQLAGDLGDDVLCARWNLALSVGAARTGRFDTADRHLGEASACLSSEDPLIDARDFVAGYLAFERGAGRSVIRDGAIEQAVERATRRDYDGDTCVGLAPLGFQLESQLPDSVMRLAERIDVEPGPPDEFTLLTASTVVGDGRAAYVSAMRDIQRGQLQTAARALEEAYAQFSHVGHLPGMARVAFIDDIIYAGRLDEWLDEDTDISPEEDIDESLHQLRTGAAHRIIDDATTSIEFASGDDLAYRIAALLIDGQDGLQRLVGNIEELPSSLCHPPSVDEDDPASARPIIIGDDTDAPDP